jgi:hypothetical protein
MEVISSNVRRLLVRALCACSSAAIAVVIVGCSDDGLGKRYAVSGKVTYKGEPVADASISFRPVGGEPGSEQRGATGVVKDGRYSLSTIGGDDGAFPGKYDVSISARAPDMSKAEANRLKTGGSARQDDVAAAFKNAKSAIPRKYEAPILKATVEAKSNGIDFDLKDD